MKVGLTGGIASGKTTTARFLSTWGAEVIDSDRLAHEATTPGAPAYAEVVAHFGTAILNPDGTIDRARLGAIVFRDNAERQRLNQIVHPRVREQWQRLASQAEAESDRTVVVAMIPLLYETNAEIALEKVIVVGCREQTQAGRLRDRGLDGNQIQARLRAQMPVPVKMERADYVIWNEYSLDLLEQQTRAVWQALTRKITDRRN